MDIRSFFGGKVRLNSFCNSLDYKFLFDKRKSQQVSENAVDNGEERKIIE